MKADHPRVNRIASWFDDPDQLLTLARGANPGWGRLPLIPGFTNFVEIGRGGQAVVYRARRVAGDEIVAIRVLRNGPADDPAHQRRFEREVEIAAALRHPGIVRIEEHGITGDGHLYAVMELVEGAPINEATRSLATRPKLEAFHRVCEAVHHAHLRGIMHRDLKPANIMIDHRGAPRVLDFGLARPQHDRETTRLARVSRTGQFVGSLAWASPEQLAAEPDQLDVRSDVYSLGVVLYELLTDRLPCDVDGPLDAVIERIVHRPPSSPRVLRPSLDEDVAAITLRCLAKLPDQRYETAGALARDLRRHLDGEPIESRRIVAWHRMQAALHRSRRLLAGALAALVFLVAVGIVTGVLYRRAATAEALAADRLAEARSEKQRSEAVTAYLERMILAADPLTASSSEITVREMLDKASARLAFDTSLDPMVRARVALRIAHVQYNLGRYALAEPLVSDALRTLRARARNRDDRLYLANAARLLGLVRHGMNRPDEAAELLRESMRTQRALTGGGDPQTFFTRIHLAVLWSAQGAYPEAQAALRAVIDEARAGCPDPSLPVAIALYRLGEMQTFLSDPDAEQTLRAAVDEAIAVTGASTLYVADAQVALADLLGAHRCREAIELAAAARETYASIVDAHHPRIADCFTSEALATARCGDLDRAVALFEQGLGILDHRDTDPRRIAHVQERLGSILSANGRPRDGAVRLRDALATYERLLGPDHPDTAITRGQLGCALHRLGHHDEAVAHLRSMRDALADHLGPNHGVGRQLLAYLDMIEGDA